LGAKKAMDPAAICIRPATPQDGLHIAKLGQIAGHGIPDFLWEQAAEPDQSPMDVGIARATSTSSSFSYRNSFLAEVNGEIAGLLIAYPLPDPPEVVDLSEVPALLHPLIELEQRVPGSYYINILATYPQFQNQGIGSRLLEHADAVAADMKCPKLSLQVFEQNQDAVRFYLREGFQVFAQKPAVPHPCYPYTGDILLMTKQSNLP